MSEETPSAHAKWQHAENVLKGYRACVTGDTFYGYEPPGHPDSARELSYRAGWTVASFDLAARRMHEAGMHCRVRGEEVTAKMELVGGTEYEPDVLPDNIGMFTGETFTIYFNDEGVVVAHVIGHHTEKVIERGSRPESIETELQAAAEFIIHTCRRLTFNKSSEPVCAACNYPINKGYPADDGKDKRCPVCGAPMEKTDE